MKLIVFTRKYHFLEHFDIERISVADYDSNENKKIGMNSYNAVPLQGKKAKANTVLLKQNNHR